MSSLKGQVIIVTGGAGGIGGALTTVLAQRGAAVVAVGINEEAGERKEQSLPERIAFSQRRCLEGINGDVSG